MKKRNIWVTIMVVVFLGVAFGYCYLYTQKVVLQEILPQMEPIYIIIYVTFGFPASYTSTIVANWWERQPTDLIITFRETLKRTLVFYLVFIPIIMMYNYLIFGQFLPPYF